jgi:hypothetical protein
MYGIIFLVVAIAVQLQAFRLTAQRLAAWRSGGLEVQMFKLALKLIEVHKLNLALNRHFCQTRVICRFFYSVQ